jgi:hypothetical protein
LPEGLVAPFTKSRRGATTTNAESRTALVPSALRTVTLRVSPAEIPDGTMANNSVPDVTSTESDAWLPTSTCAAVRKFEPSTLSSVPTVPVLGDTLRIAGVGPGPVLPPAELPPQAATMARRRGVEENDRRERCKDIVVTRSFRRSLS